MVKQNLKKDTVQPFSGSKAGKDFIVNYVWINRKPDQANRKAECSVSFKHLDCAYTNARLNPGARFNIWLDYSFLDKRSRDCLKKHYRRSAPSNAFLCDLNDIPAYRKNETFRPDAHKDIWVRVDLARVIVLEHLLKDKKIQYALYADFDVPDVRLEEAKTRMNKYGVALGTTGAGTDYDGSLENGYFGFQKKKNGPKFVKSLLRKTFEAANDNSNGYAPLMHLSLEWAQANKLQERKGMIVSKALYHMGYQIPNIPRYAKLKWN